MRTRRKPLSQASSLFNIHQIDPSLDRKNKRQSQKSAEGELKSHSIQGSIKMKQNSSKHRRTLRKFNDTAVDEYFQGILQFCQNYNNTPIRSTSKQFNPNGFEKPIGEEGRSQKNKGVISSIQRKKLVKWIFDIHQGLRLRTETLYMTVYIVDQYVKRRGIQIRNYQLLGLASLFIAGKYEEIATLKMKSLLKFFEDVYLVEDILWMESEIFKSLEFNISKPTLNWFLNAYLLELELRSDQKLPNNYCKSCQDLMEMCLFEQNIIETYQYKDIIRTIIYAACMIGGDFLNVRAQELIVDLQKQQKATIRNCLMDIRKISNKRVSGWDKSMVPVSFGSHNENKQNQIN